MPTSNPPPISLTILRRGDMLLVDVAEVGALIPRSETQVDDAFLQELAAEVSQLATPGYGRNRAPLEAAVPTVRESERVVRDLQRIGGLIFSHLLTEPVRTRLRAAEPCEVYLRLDEHLIQVPWELGFDGESFLATKFRIGRQVITGYPLPVTRTERVMHDTLKVLLIADPTQSLPQARAEAEQLYALLDGVAEVEVTLMGGKTIRKLPLLAALQDYEVVHFAGHSEYDPTAPHKSGWRLHEGLLTAAELSKLTRPPLLVFSNSCEAGSTAAWEGGYRYEGQAFGIGSAFLLAGVQNYIGTFWVVHDEESVGFALSFYRSLAAGLTLGEALHEARQATLTQSQEQGLTWASYMLYGNPTMALLPGHNGQALGDFSSAGPQRVTPPGLEGSLPILADSRELLQSQTEARNEEPAAAAVSPRMPRKLAAILSTDVKGYSRLMGEDEEATIRTLTAYRKLMSTLIQHYRGRVVDAPGDNLLAEFASAVDAVQCAVEIQKELQTRNAELPDHRKMQYRIGINVGDVISEGERLYGDGVNIAARLEALAEGGGICISGTVYDQVKNKLALKYENLGEQTVKNIAEPVRVYRVPASIPSTPPVASSQNSVVSSSEQSQVQHQDSTLHIPHSTIVGRETELTQLHRWLEKTLNGERRVVFVTGEPGIGKTTVVDAFLSGIRDQGTGNSGPAPTDPQSPISDPWIAQGQCIEQYGAGEAYLPVLSALGQLCREPGGQRLVEILGQYAPTWLVQMPALLNAADFEALQRETQGATRERMLREMAEALEALTAEKPLVLWLEDLHWSDPSTLNLLAFLARRRQPARLLVIGTSRPVEGTEHPLRTVKQELQLHGQCEELPLRLLSEEQIAAYLAVRLPVEAHSHTPLQLAHTIHQRTEGNPLFMVNVLEELLTQGTVDNSAVEGSTPATIRQMIEQQFDRFSPEEQRVIEVASVAGMEFSAAAVAAGLAAEEGEIEERCEGLARRNRLLRACGTEEWPDGTVATRYGFIHALYQEVTYERVPAGRRIRLHQRVGERLEAAYGKRAREIAAELAVHFEQGRDDQKAVQYLEQAGTNALQRSAHSEAINYLTKGLELLKVQPDTCERAQQELALQIALLTPLIATKGYGPPEVETVCSRARELCEQIGETPQLFSVLGNLCSVYYNRADLRTAHELAQQLLRLAQSEQNPIRLVWAYTALGTSLWKLGELVSARDHLERVLALYDSQKHHSYGFVQDPGVSCLCYLTGILWDLGYPDQALRSSQQALTLARSLSHPYSLAFALDCAAEIHWIRGEQYVTQEYQAALRALAREQGFVTLLAVDSFQQGLALSEQGQSEKGIAQMCQAMTALHATGSKLGRSYESAMLAEAYGKAGQTTEGLAVLAEALTTLHERSWEAELYRLKGELTLQQWKVERQQWKEESEKWKGKKQKGIRLSPQPLISSTQAEVEQEVEAWFLKAIEIAQHQQAKSWELRASMSLARLWRQQGKQHAARNMLAEVYNWFTEGFDTVDLKEAKALLDALEGQEVKTPAKSDSRRGVSGKRPKKEPKPKRSAALRLEAESPAPGVSGEEGPVLALPDKPSIAVLPFVNMSGDPEQEYFSDGLTEDLNTDLSRFSGLFVIARTSAFTYKGKAVKVQDVSRELGVRYVLEGSVRKAGGRVRITAQLADATTGHHLWAERYDRDLQDLFALQDEITQQLVSNLNAEVRQAELKRVRRIPTENLTAYDYFLRGSEYYWHFTQEMNLQARQLWEKAITLDPQFAEAYAWLGWTYDMEWTWQWSQDPRSQDPQTLERWFELAQKALALDGSLPVAHRLLGEAYLGRGQVEQAIAEAERAITLNPSDAYSYKLLAETRSIAGQPEEGIGLAEKAMRLDPRNRELYLYTVGLAYALAGRYEEAVVAFKSVVTRYPNHLGAHLLLAALYSELGREEEARAEAAKVLQLSPNFSVEGMRQRTAVRDPAVVERFLAALRQAGLK